jgi:hypothetical protein
MLSKQKIAKILISCGTIGFSGQVLASADTSAGPGGIYKLKPGIYVGSDQTCEAPKTTLVRKYSGRGIDSIHSQACIATLITRKGSRYTVTQKCAKSDEGPNHRSAQRQQIIVRDALTFTQKIDGKSTRFQYCAPYQLPVAITRALK